MHRPLIKSYLEHIELYDIDPDTCRQGVAHFGSFANCCLRNYTKITFKIYVDMDL
jgi:hypothetical protein